MRKGMGRGQGSGWKNMRFDDSRRHSLASKGVKTAQKIPRLPKSFKDHKVAEMNVLIKEVAKKYGLETAKRPSFSKVESIILPNGRALKISQKQVLADNMKGIMGGSSYEFRNSFQIVDDSKVEREQIKFNELQGQLESYLKEKLRGISLQERIELNYPKGFPYR